MTTPAKPCTPIADALRQPVKRGATFAEQLAPFAGYSLFSAPAHMPSPEELDRVLVDHAMAELRTGRHAIH